MYQVKIIKEKIRIYELLDLETNSWIRIAPERGGIITSYGVKGEELLYLDQASFDDPTANVRGGIPILFPICGQLKDQRYEWEGKTYAMKNHGLVRNLEWEVMDTEIKADFAAITIKQRSNEQTLESFPFEYELVFKIILQDQKLRIEQQYHNHSDREMPMYAGFHPYFLVDNKTNTFETDAAQIRYLGNQLKHAYTGVINTTMLPNSIALEKAPTKQISFQPKANTKIKLSYGEQFGHVVLWTETEKPFVCVEPWMAMPNELNLKEELFYVKSGEILQTFLIIELL
ncbi:MAG: aldose epimerase [Bacilli bacterium]|nr:aldose epimerase [Bacilli bacterium]